MPPHATAGGYDDFDASFTFEMLDGSVLEDEPFALLMAMQPLELSEDFWLDSQNSMDGKSNKRKRALEEEEDKLVIDCIDLTDAREEEEEKEGLADSPLLSQPPPLGLKLRNSSSLLELVEMEVNAAGEISSVESPSSPPPPPPALLFETAALALAPPDKAVGQTKLKASNFSATELRIDSWVRPGRFDGDVCTKFYFKQRKLVFEILGADTVTSAAEVPKLKIELQFDDILEMTVRSGFLEVISAVQPKFFKELPDRPKKHTLWAEIADFTLVGAGVGDSAAPRRYVVDFEQNAASPHLRKLFSSEARLFDLVQKGGKMTLLTGNTADEEDMEDVAFEGFAEGINERCFDEEEGMQRVTVDNLTPASSIGEATFEEEILAWFPDSVQNSPVNEEVVVPLTPELEELIEKLVDDTIVLPVGAPTSSSSSSSSSPPCVMADMHPPRSWANHTSASATAAALFARNKGALRDSTVNESVKKVPRVRSFGCAMNSYGLSVLLGARPYYFALA